MIDIVAMLSSSISKSETRKKEQQRLMMCDFAEAIVLVCRIPSQRKSELEAPAIGVETEKKLLRPILERAVGLGQNETLPS